MIQRYRTLFSEGSDLSDNFRAPFKASSLVFSGKQTRYNIVKIIVTQTTVESMSFFSSIESSEGKSRQFVQLESSLISPNQSLRMSPYPLEISTTTDGLSFKEERKRNYSKL